MALSPVVLGAVGTALAVLALVSAWTLWRRRRDRRPGQLVALDDGRDRGATLRSPRWKLVGRPDELRRRPDGTIVPVEWKSRRAPTGDVPASHRIQLYAYCLLVEESSGRPPPFGILRYGDRAERSLPWDDRARTELFEVLDKARRPYRGEATPSPGKCRACGYRGSCDVRAA
jgi:CRISPR-associated exonuclease Cas4